MKNWKLEKMKNPPHENENEKEQRAEHIESEWEEKNMMQKKRNRIE